MTRVPIEHRPRRAESGTRRASPAARLVVASNRLPVSVERAHRGWTVRPSSGGLVNALGPVLAERKGLWVGWPGVASEEVDDWESLERAIQGESAGRLDPVPISGDEIQKFYEGFCNGILWPLFHDLLGHCDFNPSFWPAYLQVNERFARRLRSVSTRGDFVWVHDYQLAHVASFLRPDPEQDGALRLGFFLHIPFPPLDIFLKLPWRAEMLRALLSYDAVGFQTGRDQRNFLGCVRRLMPEARVAGSDGVATVHIGRRRVTVASFPIGIHYDSFESAARSAGVARQVSAFRAALADCKVVLGVDRLDYTKGIPERLEVFSRALERYPELLEKIVLLQLVVPSREGVAEYQALKQEIDRRVGEINGHFGTPGWTPIHYLYRSVSREQLVSMYQLAEVAFVTPLKDGMNLVCKEYCACRTGDDGVVVLSEFAGAAAQLCDGAVLVNPLDIDGMADALRAAIAMDEPEQRRRMRAMRRVVRDEDVGWWVDRYLSTAFGFEGDAPASDSSEYLPVVSASSSPGA